MPSSSFPCFRVLEQVGLGEEKLPSELPAGTGILAMQGIRKHYSPESALQILFVDRLHRLGVSL